MSLWDDLVPELQREFKEHPSDFLRQPTFKRALHPNQQGVATAYLKVLRKSRWVDVNLLRDPKFGKPLLCEGQFFSPLTVQHAYYFHLMSEAFGDFRRLDIAEIGGGYGNMKRLAMLLGHTGNYGIIDLVPMKAIQEVYLQNVALEGACRAMPAPAKGAVLVATFSVSEMQMGQREALESAYPRFNYLFFAHNREIDGIDNYAYFDAFTGRFGGFDWKFIDDPLRKARFVLGVRK